MRDSVIGPRMVVRKMHEERLKPIELFGLDVGYLIEHFEEYVPLSSRRRTFEDSVTRFSGFPGKLLPKHLQSPPIKYWRRWQGAPHVALLSAGPLLRAP